MMSGFIIVPAVLLGLSLLVMGVLFIRDGETGLRLSGHEVAALPSVMGGRYLGLGALVLGLLYLADPRALALAFGIGAFLGFFDGVVTHKVGGAARGHVMVGLICLLLCLALLSYAPFAGVS